MTAEEQNEAHKDDLASAPAPKGPAGEDAKPQIPADDDLFAGEVYEELSERQIFVGDEDFFQSLEQHAQGAAFKPDPGKKQKTQIPPQQGSRPPPRGPQAPRGQALCIRIQFPPTLKR